MTIFKGTTEPKKIYYGEPIIVSDMQGPAPDGFHVPLTTEWQAVYDIWTALGGGSSDGTNFGTALKLPFAGYRGSSSAGVSGQGSLGYYWSSSRYNTNYAYNLYFSSTALYPQSADNRANGFSVRCFKNSPVVPTSNWTKLYGTSIESGGIFWSSADGLISLSSDGSTWITIADKNLGATTVWNSGNTLSEANCGKYYQWGNNYGFPRTGSVTTSSTQVNASTYGPGNYYSSSTFITRSSSPYRWDTTDNGNLWGGESQGTSEKPREVTAVYLGDTKVRPAYKPRTFTISRTEKSDMSSGWTYSDDAAGLTAGDGAFDDFFGYSAVLLNTSGVETAEMTQSGGVFTGAMTTLGNITSGDNVMIKFPVRGIKMSKSGSTVTLSITKELNKDGYQYYAFNRNGTIKDNLYLGAYKGSRVNNVLKSRSGQSAATSNTGNGVGYISLSNTTTGARACARANNTSISTGSNGWDEITWYARNYINALYMMKYGNPNSQSVVGQGYTGGSSVVNTGGTDNQTSATYGTSSNTVQCKLFGLEDRWGNYYEWLDGAFYNSSTNLRTATTNVLTNTSWRGAIFNQDVPIKSVSGSYLKVASGTNEGMFAATDGSGSNSTYYCDYFLTGSGYGLYAGGSYGIGANAGAFYVDYDAVSHDSYVYFGSRLMFL